MLLYVIIIVVRGRVAKLSKKLYMTIYCSATLNQYFIPQETGLHFIRDYVSNTIG